MPKIELRNATIRNCHDLNLTIRNGEYFVIVGETGAGKTTLLNMIAGVEKYTGSVLIDDVVVNPLPPFKRGVGYLFQELALFPHFSVMANIGFGLKAQGYQKNAIKERISFLLDLMQIRHLAGRFPHQISGGEKKRVALARSLAPSPKTLLLDEPTSSLDPRTAKHLSSELHDILKKLGVTTVHVTHDLKEAERISDRIAFMANGSIEQVATPAAFFFDPANTSVAEFIGMPNILECRQTRPLASGLVEIVSDDLKIILPCNRRHIRKIAIPPDAVDISDVEPSELLLNHFVGTVEKIIQHNATVKLQISIGKNRLISELTASAFMNMFIAKGTKVYGAIKMNRLRYIE
ncbi:MAG: ABC transporter ATP-binding protein [Desulfotignum sp.]|nr:ABC transporter ATP-binding protein [Desulfotignum sp.]MCF8136629.1 ABC transporter ATP-binding protein [Desulfotignum sp.]